MPSPTLTSDELRLLSRLLDQCLDMPVDGRQSWLEGLTDGSESLRQRLRLLLQQEAHFESDDFLNALPQLSTVSGYGPASAHFSGEEVGRYRLISEIGRGGMASVWLAEGTEGYLQRRVALKLPHLPAANSPIAERFERERDILAGLTHANIARLYDAGVSDSGQPYLAMEYLEGTPLLTYCDTQHLGVRERVQLFIDILLTVSYAHSRLVIHRDLKPSNILVADGRIFLLDFGIAKLLVDGESMESELTHHGGRALTLSYASPEQIVGLPLGTATDIYSLGVILHELLCGQLPYELKRDTRGALEDAILEGAPQRPSQGTGVEHAKHCGIPMAKLVNLLRGDLDAVVAKALRKTPNERYPDAREFAADLERYLSLQPVGARQGARAYVLRRFVRRNWRGVALAAIAFFFLLIGVGAVAWQARIAGTEAAKALAVRDFLLNIFRQNTVNNPDGEIARQATAEQLLDIGGKNIMTALKDQPEVRAEMLATVGDLYGQLDLFDKAIAIDRERVTYLEHHGGHASEVAAAEVSIARSLVMEGNYSAASEELDKAEAILDHLGDHTSATRARALLTQGMVNYYTKPISDGQSSIQLRQAADLYARCCASSADRLDVLQMLARVAEKRTDFTEAERQTRAFLALANTPVFLAQQPIGAAHAYDDLGSFLLTRRKFVEAEADLRHAVDIYARAEGPTAMDTMNAKAYLGRTLVALNRPVEGQAYLEESLRAMEKTQGVDNIASTATSRLFLAAIQLTRGDLAESEQLLAQNAKIFQAAETPDACPTQCALSFGRLATVMIARGDWKAAQSALTRSDQALQAIHGESFEAYGRNRVAGAVLKSLQGNPETAIEELHTALEKWPLSDQDLPEPYVLAGLALTESLFQSHQDDQALQQATALLSAILASPTHEYFADWEARAQGLVGKILNKLSRSVEAEKHLRREVELRQLIDVDNSPWLAAARVGLANNLISQRHWSEAQNLLAQANHAESAQSALGPQFRFPLKFAVSRLHEANRSEH